MGELPLKDCVKFWGSAAGNLATRDIIDVLAVTGGVPRYLEEINPALSANENIRRMCFVRKSPLREDFDDMFFDVIAAQPSFTGHVLRCLVDGPLTSTEVAARLALPKGGNVSAALDRLVEAGLVSRDHGRNPETGRPVHERRYRLMDNYTRFYLKYIEPVKNIIDDGSYAFTSLEQLKGMDAVLGLAFENLVVNHYRELLPRLGLSRALIESAAPFVKRGRAGKNGGGCQVDLLIQAAQSCCVVEIKRRREISDDVVDEMKKKLNSLSLPKDLSVRTALVYDGGAEGVELTNKIQNINVTYPPKSDFLALKLARAMMAMNNPGAAVACANEVDAHQDEPGIYKTMLEKVEYIQSGNNVSSYPGFFKARKQS